MGQSHFSALSLRNLNSNSILEVRQSLAPAQRGADCLTIRPKASPAQVPNDLPRPARIGGGVGSWHRAFPRHQRPPRRFAPGSRCHLACRRLERPGNAASTCPLPDPLSRSSVDFATRDLLFLRSARVCEQPCSTAATPSANLAWTRRRLHVASWLPNRPSSTLPSRNPMLRQGVEVRPTESPARPSAHAANVLHPRHLWSRQKTAPHSFRSFV